MADLDLDFAPVAPNSASPEQAVNTGFAKVVAAIRILADEGASGLPEGGAPGQFLAILPDGTVGWANAAGGGGGEGGDTIYAACVCYINDANGTVDQAKTKKNNVGTIERIEAGRWRFNFSTPLPDLDCHVSASAIYSSFADNWRSRVELGRHPDDRFDLNHITFWTPNQNDQNFDPVRLEFRIVKFR